MPLKFFVVPVMHSSEFEAEVNGFLGCHKVVSIDRELVQQGDSWFWAICVEYISAEVAASKGTTLSRSRLDYKLILTPTEFELFSRLRTMRKEIAQAEAVPVYTLFTNEQLAQIVQRKCKTKVDLLSIEGIGEARLEKCLEQILAILNSEKSLSNEAPR